MAQQQQAIHKFVLGNKEFENKNSEFQYDRGWYSITDITGEEREVIYKSKNAQEAYMKWNVYIGRKKERPVLEERQKNPVENTMAENRQDSSDIRESKENRERKERQERNERPERNERSERNERNNYHKNHGQKNRNNDRSGSESPSGREERRDRRRNRADRSRRDREAVHEVE